MADYKFYMKKVLFDAQGKATKGQEYDLEQDFPGLRYKSMSGLNLYGKPTNDYTETFAETERARVFIGSDTREQTSLTLTLYFFDPLKFFPVSPEPVGTTPYSRMVANYHNFMNTISGCGIIWHDTARGRYVYMYHESAQTISKDMLLDTQYIEVQIKFKNVYGRSFDSEDQITI
ncbi:MAG: hypothetical protein HUK08_00200 [Bacteroidaceae bacterium]|nr:hypothetical protein [Bacteroidaceae bacterium]